MSWVAVVVGTALVGSAVVGADAQRSAAHRSADALKRAQDEDARNAAEAETNAAVAANAQLADAKRRRRSSSLSGDVTQTALGGGGLPAGMVARGAASPAASYAGTALGAGMPATTVATRPAGGTRGGIPTPIR